MFRETRGITTDRQNRQASSSQAVPLKTQILLSPNKSCSRAMETNYRANLLCLAPRVRTLSLIDPRMYARHNNGRDEQAPGRGIEQRAGLIWRIQL